MALLRVVEILILTFERLHCSEISIWGLESYIGVNSDINIGRVAYEACIATRNLGSKSAFSLELRKTSDDLVELAGRNIFWMQTDF
jgi:hypothetical protein